jgi:hypothetical protein
MEQSEHAYRQSREEMEKASKEASVDGVSQDRGSNWEQVDSRKVRVTWRRVEFRSDKQIAKQRRTRRRSEKNKKTRQEGKQIYNQ